MAIIPSIVRCFTQSPHLSTSGVSTPAGCGRLSHSEPPERLVITDLFHISTLRRRDRRTEASDQIGVEHGTARRDFSHSANAANLQSWFRAGGTSAATAFTLLVRLLCSVSQAATRARRSKPGDLQRTRQSDTAVAILLGCVRNQRTKHEPPDYMSGGSIAWTVRAGNHGKNAIGLPRLVVGQFGPRLSWCDAKNGCASHQQGFGLPVDDAQPRGGDRRNRWCDPSPTHYAAEGWRSDRDSRRSHRRDHGRLQRRDMADMRPRRTAVRSACAAGVEVFGGLVCQLRTTDRGPDAVHVRRPADSLGCDLRRSGEPTPQRPRGQQTRLVFLRALQDAARQTGAAHAADQRDVAGLARSSRRRFPEAMRRPATALHSTVKQNVLRPVEGYFAGGQGATQTDTVGQCRRDARPQATFVLDQASTFHGCDSDRNACTGRRKTGHGPRVGSFAGCGGRCQDFQSTLLQRGIGDRCRVVDDAATGIVFSVAQLTPTYGCVSRFSCAAGGLHSCNPSAVFSF